MRGEEEEEDVSVCYMNEGREGILKTERGSTRWHFVQNSLWKRLWTCRETG